MASNHSKDRLIKYHLTIIECRIRSLNCISPYQLIESYDKIRQLSQDLNTLLKIVAHEKAVIKAVD